MTSPFSSRVRPVAVLAAIVIAASGLVGLGASAANATGTTFKTHKASISGTVKVGHTLAITMTTWSPKPTTKTYQWIENGVSIPDATAKTYVLTPEDLGKSISVSVTGTKTSYTDATVTSTAKTVAPGTFTAGTPKITGSAKVGLTLSASTGSWKPTPSSFGYQWKRNKVAIPEATDSTYTVQGSDAGKAITVTVTAALTGYTNTSSTSSKTSSVTVQTPITKDGTHLVGGTTGLAAGTYVTTSSSLSYCYWARVNSSNEIIANSDSAGQSIVTVKSSDYKLETDFCGKWIRLADAPSPLLTTFKTGTYAVGQSIAPGTYTALKGGSDCFWETLNGFLGDDDSTAGVDEVIDNGIGATPTVTITDGVVGFTTSFCGTWTKVSVG